MANISEAKNAWAAAAAHPHDQERAPSAVRGTEAYAVPSHAVSHVRFSVVVPLYNKARYVRAAVQSVLDQSYPNFEIIVVDDGSTDDGCEQLRDIDDPRLVVIRQANAGVSIARNRGIDAARGDWVCFLDADDLFHPGYLAALAAAEEIHPELSVVATRFSEFHGDPLPQAQTPARGPTMEVIDDLPARWCAGPTFFTSSVAVRGELLKSMQPCFPPGEHMGEDLDLWFRLAERQPFGLLHKALVARRVGLPDSLSELQVRCRPPFLERMRARALSAPADLHQQRSALRFVAHVHVDLARQAAIAGERLEALQWLLQAPQGPRTRRWWVALCMVACWPGVAIHTFQKRVQPGFRPTKAGTPPGWRMPTMRTAAEMSLRVEAVRFPERSH